MSDRICSIEDCPKPYLASGLCGTHYARKRRLGDPLAKVQTDHPERCTAEGCDAPYRARGLCEIHYGEQLRRERGIPKQVIRVGCTVEDCDNPHYGRGMCDKHYMAEWWAARPGVRSEYQAKYRARHPDRILASSVRRRTIVGVVEEFTKEEIFDRDGWACQLEICLHPDGRSIDRSLRDKHPWMASLDHTIPISKNGCHTPDNVQAAHLRCNQSKGNRMTDRQAEGW